MKCEHNFKVLNIFRRLKPHIKRGDSFFSSKCICLFGVCVGACEIHEFRVIKKVYVFVAKSFINVFDSTNDFSSIKKVKDKDERKKIKDDNKQSYTKLHPAFFFFLRPRPLPLSEARVAISKTLSRK